MTTAGSGPTGFEPEVRTAAGVLRGRTEQGVAVFRGVPFAAPPVGTLRFAAPRPAGGWDGVREAVSYGPPPPQAGYFGMDAMARNAGTDWLTVNVWSPDPSPGAALPVLVWVQGGAYSIGASGLPEYDGARLAREGGLVLVTFNYRVGMEGFAHVDGAPANRGLLDQVAALEWVRDAIGAFGGDPDRVTVFGQSAGAGSIAALVAMPRAVGLFHRAIAQSVPGTFFSPELAADIAAAVAAGPGLRPTVAELSAVPPERLAAAGDVVAAKSPSFGGRWGPSALRSIPFSPVVDGDVLPVTPWQALARGAGRDIGLVVGHTREEQRLFTALEGALGQVTEEQAATALEAFAPGPDGAHRYRTGFPAAGPEELYELVHSDWLFRMPSLHLAEAQLSGGGRAHVYELAWPAPGMGGVLGACHGLDVPLVFGNLASGQPAALIGERPSPAAEELSAAFRTAWSAFATHGDPGWPGYDRERRLTRVFGERPSVAPYPEETSRLLRRDHVFAALPLLVQETMR
ncbi:carboxylesterase/lipase family protein [Streptomyces barringtoniae]|uniref:carboxylesterase/lipase family protein n=1 Tax=Streptomyces barringtoniae TaxID=2892029 RepID=UPI001E474567|nr:carboxylesterase family protein [Streptomyces barringtoniae]MCC5475539.1 carboxylesterase family protein [Streptomyces barringtoniae]